MSEIVQTQETGTQSEGSTGVDTLVSDAVPTSPESGGAAEARKEVLISDLGLDEDMLSNPSLKDIPNARELVKSFIHSQKLTGHDKIVLPGKDATDEDWANVYNKLGRPKEAADYGLKAREGISEDLVSQEGVDAYSQFAHKAGLTTKQANDSLNFFTDMQVAVQEADNQATIDRNTSNIDSLKADFGNAFETNIGIVSSFLSNIEGGDEFRSTLNEAKLGTSPVVIKTLLKLASAFGEDRLEGMDKMNTLHGSSLTPEAAAAELHELDKNEGLYNKNHVDHQKLVARRAQLLRDMHPEDVA